ncbi:MAG: hypothetical protein AAGJ10_08825 [Bacteroidota bacterium]
MFDLDRAIAEWRTAFERDAAFARHEIDELEAHLRDSVAERIAAGERLSEAFDAVRASLGAPSVLRTDFQQVDVWSKGWIRYLRLVAIAGLGLYAAFILAQVLVGRIDTEWIREIWRTGVVSTSYVLRLANALVYIGAMYMLFKVRPTRQTRMLGSLSLMLSCAAMGILAASAAGILPRVGLSGVNALLIIGLVSGISYTKQRSGVDRIAFIACLVGFSFELWRVWTLAGMTGRSASATVAMTLLSLSASGVAGLAVWHRWHTAPLKHRLA